MNKTNDFKYNLPAYSDPVDIEDLNDNFRGIDDALMAGLCKKDYTGNNMGSSDPSARKYAWAPWLEIVNDNEFDVVVTDRNAPVGSEEATINIAAGQTFRKYINGRYYMNFYVQDQHDVTFKWFTNAETYINESGGGGGGTGTVTSVSVQGGSGSHLTGSGNPIETSGTITINVDEGYSIPSDNEQDAWDVKAADLKLEINSSTYVITAQLKDSSGNLIGNERTIDLPLETMVVDGEYDPQTQKIKLELKNGNYVEFSVADLVSGLQTELSASNKLDPDYIDYDSTHRAVTDTEKDTWNGKQNALTFDDTPTQNSNNPVKSGGIYTALAGKQASLDSTQLAAVNSGIDSSKVGQISTNQTNILYALRKVGTNMFNFEAWANKVTVTNSGTKSVSENTITISATTNSDTYTEYSENQYPVDARIPVNAGDKLYMSWDYSSADNITGNVYIFGNASTSSMASADATAGHLEYTVPTSGISYITMRVGLGTNQSGKSGTWSNIQIIMKSAYDSGTTEFAPYALPNYDLTRLEAEDRASLAEVVDSGAKNLCTNSSITSQAVAGFSDVSWFSEPIPAGTYVLRAKITSTQSSQMQLVNVNNRDIVTIGPSAPSGTNADYISTPFTITEKAYGFKIYSNAAPTTWTDIMICTKAAFVVSKAFVPYRPNYDLVQFMLPKSKTVDFTVTSADTYQTVEDLKVAIPSGYAIRVTTSAWRNNSITPTGIRILTATASTELGNSYLVSATENPVTDQLALSTTGAIKNIGAETLYSYIQVKFPSTGTYRVTIFYDMVTGTCTN